jgi:hypothetical protein
MSEQTIKELKPPFRFVFQGHWEDEFGFIEDKENPLFTIHKKYGFFVADSMNEKWGRDFGKT